MVVAFASIGMPIVYFMLFGEIGSTLLRDFGISESSFFGTHSFSIIILAIFLYYFIVQKQIEEIKIASISLFSGIVGFALILLIKLIAGMETAEKFPEDENIWYPDLSDFEMWACLASILLAYTFQTVYFPAYGSLKV